jgi:hypothetical protein
MITHRGIHVIAMQASNSGNTCNLSFRSSSVYVFYRNEALFDDDYDGLRNGSYNGILSVHQLKTHGWNSTWYVTFLLLSILKKRLTSQQFYSGSGCASSDVSVRSEPRPLSLLLLEPCAMKKTLLSSSCTFCDEQKTSPPFTNT